MSRKEKDYSFVTDLLCRTTTTESLDLVPVMWLSPAYEEVWMFPHTNTLRVRPKVTAIRVVFIASNFKDENIPGFTLSQYLFDQNRKKGSGILK